MNITFRTIRQMYRGNFTAKAIAGAMDMPVRTLRTLLSMEGSSFKSIKGAVRLRLAVQLTSQGKTPLCIIVELDYAHTSNFFRAFERWTGENYTAWKERVYDTPTLSTAAWF